MTDDAWTRSDPEPGELDADLEAIDPRHVAAYPGDPSATLTIVAGIEGEDAERLQALASRRKQRPAEVISALLRSA